MQMRNLMAMITGCGLLFLSASGFADWPINENFDGQTPGARCQPFLEDGKQSYISDEQDATQGGAGKSCKMSVAAGASGWGGEFLFPTRPKRYDEVWIRFRLYVPPGFDSYVPDQQGAILKFVRVELRNATDTQQGKIDWLWTKEGDVTPYLSSLENYTICPPCVIYFGNTSQAPVYGVWETYEMYVKFDLDAKLTGGQGMLQFWKNGQLIAEQTQRPTMWAGSTQAVTVLIFSSWNGGSPQNQFVYLDDLITTNVVPGATDAAGNPYIGVGDYVFIPPPAPPGSVQAR